jgi:hypothetical protein
MLFTIATVGFRAFAVDAAGFNCGMINSCGRPNVPACSSIRLHNGYQRAGNCSTIKMMFR